MQNKILRILFKSLKYLLLFTAIFLLASARLSYSSFVASDMSTKLLFFKPVIQKLLSKKADSAFIYHLLSDPRTKFEERYVRINVTGFLRKTDYSRAYDRASVNKAARQMNENYSIFDSAEKKFSVPKELIATILWIETKFGSYTGNNQLATVFLSTAMADQPQFVKLNKEELRKGFNGDTSELPALEKKLETRSHKKAQWAINELLSLNKMYSKYSIPVTELRGSWAGAFGYPQFLPSSYLKHAVDGNGDGTIDLFALDDAVYSIASYMKAYGWNNSDPESQRKAIYSYNNSNDYVDAVITLQHKIEQSNRNRNSYGPDTEESP